MSGEALVSAKPSVAVCLAATDEVKTFFTVDLAKLVGHTIAGGAAVSIYAATGSLIPKQRELLANAVVANGHSHAFFVDSDMRFPKDALLGLLERKLPIVGAGYTARHGPPFLPLVVKNMETDERVYTDAESTGVEQIEALGFGCILIEADVFRKMTPPHFNLGWAVEQKDFVGEDIFFCVKAKRAGIPVHVDHDLSKLVAHIGLYQYTWETAIQSRQLMMAAEQFAKQEKPLIEVAER